MGKRGTIVIPAKLRRQFHLEAGSYITIATPFAHVKSNYCSLYTTNGDSPGMPHYSERYVIDDKEGANTFPVDERRLL